jgi:hypothetical protein
MLYLSSRPGHGRFIRHLLFSAFACSSFFLLSSCKKDTELAATLPEVTDHGANTFGMVINGKVVSARGSENISGGIGELVFVAYLTSLCNKNFSATQYALFTSLGSLARSLLASSAGIYAHYLGWYHFFIFSVFLAIPALAFLFLIGKNSNLLRNNQN